MLFQRVFVAVILLPIGLYAIHLGGWPYALVIALLIGLAAWEYARLFRAGGWEPSGVLTVLGVLLLLGGSASSGAGSWRAACWLR